MTKLKNRTKLILTILVVILTLVVSYILLNCFYPSQNNVSSAGSIASIVGLLFALFTMYESHNLNEEIKDANSYIKDIHNAIQTKYIGMFPDNMESINELISKTKSELIILTDIPAYGHFSNQKEYDRYKNLLGNKKINDIDIKIISYDCEDKEAYPKKIEHQFNLLGISKASKYDCFIKLKGKELIKFMGEDLQSGSKKNYSKAKKYDIIIDKFRKDNRDIIELLKKIDNDFNYRVITWDKTSQIIPMTMWIRDSKEAVFSFLEYFEDFPTEKSFYTRDEYLIDHLMKTFIALSKEKISKTYRETGVNEK